MESLGDQKESVPDLKSNYTNNERVRHNDGPNTGLIRKIEKSEI